MVIQRLPNGAALLIRHSSSPVHIFAFTFSLVSLSRHFTVARTLPSRVCFFLQTKVKFPGNARAHLLVWSGNFLFAVVCLRARVTISPRCCFHHCRTAVIGVDDHDVPAGFECALQMDFFHSFTLVSYRSNSR